MKILIILDHYLPGFKAGGPIRSIANLVGYLGKDYEFCILTRDRDIDDVSPYAEAKDRTWRYKGNALVKYMRPIECGLAGLWKNLSRIEYDLIYLNSFFSRLTIRIMLMRKIGLIRKGPMVLAPRGEFSPGAISIKAYKKLPYLWFCRLIGLYWGIIWHASTTAEADDIRRQFGALDEVVRIGEVPIRIASDPLSYSDHHLQGRDESFAMKKAGEARIVFLSRISRKKNLEYALNLLSQLSGKVKFDIYGPIEDFSYWRRCQKVISALPSSVHVAYAGQVPANEVQKVFSEYHLFLFPTLGENFGHVIPEALSAGCLVLLSDRTPWRGLEQAAIGWDIALEDSKGFQSALEMLVAMDNQEFARRSGEAKAFMVRYIERQRREMKHAYERVFDISILRDH